MQYTIKHRGAPAISEEVRLQIIYDELAEYPPEVRERFDAIVAKGTSPRLALGLALRQCNVWMKGGGDQIFNRVARRNMENMDPWNREKILQIAKKAGINTNGKFYNPQLGRYHEKEAWVSSAQDVLDVCKKKNLNASGYVNHVATKPDKPPERKALSERLIKECTDRILKNEPETAAKLKEGRLKPQELRERVIDRHGRKRKPA